MPVCPCCATASRSVSSLCRTEVDPFSEKQSISSDFADQAVIAIEKRGTVRGRADAHEGAAGSPAAANRDRRVLKTISRSAFDLETVLTELVRSGVSLCEADFGHIRRRQGDVYNVAASFGLTPSQHEEFAALPSVPGRGSVPGRALLEGRVVHFPDVLADPEFTRLELQKSIGFRAAVAVPLINNGQIVGVMNLHRRSPGPFSASQISLLETFADQAVIAIENARLFEAEQTRTKELTEFARIPDRDVRGSERHLPFESKCSRSSTPSSRARELISRRGGGHHSARPWGG